MGPRDGHSTPGRVLKASQEWQSRITSLWTAGHAAFDAAQDVDGFLGCKCILSGPAELLAHNCPWVVLVRAVLYPSSTQSLLVFGIALTPVQGLALFLVVLCEFLHRPSCQACPGSPGFHSLPPRGGADFIAWCWQQTCHQQILKWISTLESPLQKQYCHFQDLFYRHSVFLAHSLLSLEEAVLQAEGSLTALSVQGSAELQGFITLLRSEGWRAGAGHSRLRRELASAEQARSQSCFSYQAKGDLWTWLHTAQPSEIVKVCLMSFHEPCSGGTVYM